MENKFGLKEEDIRRISNIISNNDSVEKVVIFGSRAMGNYKHGSDVDLALFGDNIDDDVVLKISFELNENTVMPYKFDVLNGETVNDDIKKHITEEGIVFAKFDKYTYRE